MSRVRHPPEADSPAIGLAILGGIVLTALTVGTAAIFLGL